MSSASEVNNNKIDKSLNANLIGPFIPFIQQLTRLLVLLFMVTTLLFFMLRLAGDPALVLAGND